MIMRREDLLWGMDMCDGENILESVLIISQLKGDGD